MCPQTKPAFKFIGGSWGYGLERLWMDSQTPQCFNYLFLERSYIVERFASNQTDETKTIFLSKHPSVSLQRIDSLAKLQPK